MKRQTSLIRRCLHALRDGDRESWAAVLDDAALAELLAALGD